MEFDKPLYNNIKVKSETRSNVKDSLKEIRTDTDLLSYPDMGETANIHFNFDEYTTACHTSQITDPDCPNTSLVSVKVEPSTNIHIDSSVELTEPTSDTDLPYAAIKKECLESSSNGEKRSAENLVKKWKNKRKFYLKGRKKNHPAQSAVKRKDKHSSYNFLSFLDTVKKKKPTARKKYSRKINPKSRRDQFTDVDTTTDQSSEQESPAAKRKSQYFNKSAQAMTSFQTNLLSTLEKKQGKDPYVEAINCFLLSLVPDVAALNERQNMQFRLGILNLLNQIKFGPTQAAGLHSK